MKTAAWARKHDVCTDEIVPAVPNFNKRYARSAREIAARCLILQGIGAVAYGCNAKPIVDWFSEQNLTVHISPEEERFFKSKRREKKQCYRFQWHAEAEWTLLWLVGKVDSLGLPTQTCDTRRLVDEIIPPLGDSVKRFLSTAKLRSSGEILAEDDRTYNLWCYVHQARRNERALPEDLNYFVLYERRYAFEWLDGFQEWDKVTCDA